MHWARAGRAGVVAASAIALVGVSACSVFDRSAAGPSAEQSVAVVSATMRAAVLAIPGVTEAVVSYIPAHDLNGAMTSGEIICSRCDRDGLKRVVDTAMPKLAELTPAAKDEPSIAPVAMTKRGQNMDQWVGPSAVGFSSDYPRLSDVKQHYGL